VAADRRAEARGVRTGMSLADAQGAVPDLVVAEADEEADHRLLEQIAEWCDRYTPLVALDPPNGLFLDISGCAHLFAKNGRDGEWALLGDCLGRLEEQGFEAQGAIASTAGAAWALARYAGGGSTPPDGQAEALAPLPVAALRIDAAEEALLDRLGLKRIGQLVEVARAPLAARFGRRLLRRLDQALGREDEALSPLRSPPRLSAERRFAEPVADLQSLLETVAALACTLSPALERNGLGARLLEAAFFRVDGQVSRLAVGTASPLRRPDTIAMLFSERLATVGETWEMSFGFDLVRLSVLEADPLDAVQIDFAAEALGYGLDRLVDRLGARLGASRITRLLPVDTHIPERAVLAQPVAIKSAAAPAWMFDQAPAEIPPDRPLRLFARPEPVEVIAEVPEGPPLRFRWRRVLYDVARAEGPERIMPEWWRPEDTGHAPRDYFRVEDRDGRRYWLYREGLLGGETKGPVWYLHGLFG
jgi:protein ImuB